MIVQPGKPFIDFPWIFSHLDDIWLSILQHVVLTVIPLTIGFLISLGLAIVTVRLPRTYGPVTGIAGILYTIPSLAAFALLRPIFGLSLITAIIPLTTYTMLILVRNINAGFVGVPPDVLEAAEGMGYTRRQRLVRIEVPLAIPLALAGLRLASVTVIGLATVVAVLGDSFGGLGLLITDGLQTFFPTKYLLGAILSVVLAFTVDFLFIRFERLVTPWAHARAGVR